MLAAKLRTLQAFGPQLLPKQALSLGLLAAKTADIGTQLFWRAHNKELYRRISEMMGEERNGAEADEESRAEVPLRPVTIFAAAIAKIPPVHLPRTTGEVQRRRSRRRQRRGEVQTLKSADTEEGETKTGEEQRRRERYR